MQAHLIAARKQRLAEALEAAEFDAFLAVSPANVDYATGYRSVSGAVHGRSGIGVFVGATGSAGNASTRLEAFATSKGGLIYGTIPEVEALFAKQIQEMDRKKREEMLHQIQRILADRVTYAPIWENGFIRAFGPRVEEAGLTLIPAFPYSAPLEDLRLKPSAP